MEQSRSRCGNEHISGSDSWPTSGKYQDICKSLLCTTMPSPFQLTKQVSANRNATLREAASAILARGPIKGCYQGLLPWVCSQSRISSIDVNSLIEIGCH